MALKYNVSYENTAIIGNKKIKFRPWTTKNEKDYLIAVEAEDEITDEMLYNILIKPCIEDSDSIVLTENEQKMLMIEIRKKSLGSSFPMQYTCRKCKNVNDLDVEFDKIVKFQPDDFKEVTHDDISIKFGPIISENLRDKLSQTETRTDYAFMEFLVHINSITINGKEEDTFSFDELKSFIEDMPSSLFDEFFKDFKKMISTLKFELTTYCMMCNEANEIDFDYIPNFLWV